MEVRIRSASPADLDSINGIYNHFALNSTATFHEQAVTSEDRLAWWREREGRFPVLVADNGGEVLGWADLGPHKGRCAYRFTAEDSVYVRPEAHGRGIGRRLLGELLTIAAAGPWRSILAVICAESAPSLRLHAALGFHEAGRLSGVGYKFGRWLDVVYMQMHLKNSDRS